MVFVLTMNAPVSGGYSPNNVISLAAPDECLEIQVTKARGIARISSDKPREHRPGQHISSLENLCVGQCFCARINLETRAFSRAHSSFETNSLKLEQPSNNLEIPIYFPLVNAARVRTPFGAFSLEVMIENVFPEGVTHGRILLEVIQRLAQRGRET